MKKSNPKRRARESKRAYGPPKRRKWIAGLPCSVPGCNRGPIHNAHVKPEGRPHDGPSGMGRKGDYTQVIPLCAHHHDELDKVLGQRLFNDKYGIDVDFVAVYIQDLWTKEAS